LSARMAMNTRLSIPSTNSRTISVSRPSQAVGSASHSISEYSSKLKGLNDVASKAGDWEAPRRCS